MARAFKKLVLLKGEKGAHYDPIWHVAYCFSWSCIAVGVDQVEFKTIDQLQFCINQHVACRPPVE